MPLNRKTKILKEIETSEGDCFRLIKKLDKLNENEGGRLYVEGDINLDVEWLKQKHSGLYNMAITKFPGGRLPLKPEIIHDPHVKYGQTSILEQEEKAYISAFENEYKNLHKSKKLNIIKKIVMPS